ncbi:ATP-binding region, ATPase-like protein [Shewanella denitrificans OS217]|jgi:two-component system, OmpR family, sensor histidine kinase CpxA|uniref:histidine kinase n=2 Tax=Shewanella TaxID=22 RepID=Q12II9_SHEDO|nr:ATP-binding region, ATPase-like protein [Shewanella denitrificans OS217]
MMANLRLPSNLFIKLLLGFWLCSSVIIAFVSLLPLLQQSHDRAPLTPQLQQLLVRASERIQDHPRILSHGFPVSGRPMRQPPRDPPVRRSAPFERASFYLLDAEGRIQHTRHPTRALRKFILMAEEAEQAISHQFKNELFFGPYAFKVNGKAYQIIGRLPDHHPRPWFFFFADNKLLTAAIAIFLSGLLSALLAWYLGKPLSSLKRSAHALAKGDLTSRVSERITHRQDEMGQLASTFNTMADAVQSMVNNQQRLMGDISHELRTPLTRLQLALALARKKGQHSEELERISYEALQLEALISELLTLSRVSLANHENKRRLGLAESLSQVLDDAEFEAEQQGKHLQVVVDEALQLSHYPKALSRAIENLLRNAIRYASANITIAAVLQGEQVVITIQDDGQGVPEAELEAIFKPFYRPDSARDRQSGGWGLGLAITQAAIHLHQGSIIAENLSASRDKQQGLKLTIKLPVS